MGDPLKGLRKSAGSLAGLGLSIGVGAGIAARAPPGTPNLTRGFSVLAGFAPLAVTAKTGKDVLKTVRKIYGS